MAVIGSRSSKVLVAKPVGRDAATKKYDILSALTTFALSQDKHRQRQVMRLIALITTRYNWQRDELLMGQAEIARLWSVDTRTVKREMTKLRAMGWLVEKRAGVRGRVALHGLNLNRMMEETRHCWALIGSDFVARMEPATAPVDTNVVPFQSATPPTFEDSDWGRIGATYDQLDPAGYRAWVAALVPVETEAGVLSLAAPSRFHANYVAQNLGQRLLLAAQQVDPAIRHLHFVSETG